MEEAYQKHVYYSFDHSTEHSAIYVMSSTKVRLSAISQAEG